MINEKSPLLNIPNNEDKVIPTIDPQTLNSPSNTPQQIYKKSFYVFASIIACFVIFAGVATYQNPSKSTNQNKLRYGLNKESTNVLMYKHTTSISYGSYSTVKDFVNTYITSTEDAYNLGCDSMKVVGDVLGFQIHWVDTTIFPTAGKGISDFTSYVSSLGTTTFNEYMHDKIVFYVPTLSAHYTKLNADGISAMYRLSTSPGSTSIDTAHISIFLADAATVYEIVGPVTSLTDDQLSTFTEWSAAECPISHQLQESLTSLQNSYDVQYSATTDALKTWATNSGLPILLPVQTSTPTQSMDYISNTISMITDVTGATVTYATTSDGLCSIATISGIDPLYVSYVTNSGTGLALEYSVKEREEDATLSHTTYQTGSNWDRYLDNHLGIQLGTSDTCDSDFTSTDATITKYGFSYSMRVTDTAGYGTHFYTTSAGVRTIEFNLDSCAVSGYPDICGCTVENRNDEYYVNGVLTTCAIDTKAKY